MCLLEVVIILFGHFCLKSIPLSLVVSWISLVFVYMLLFAYGYYVCLQQLNEYQHQVDISMMESEASFNLKYSEAENSNVSETSLDNENTKKNS